jgi:dienelactone hydrolase
VNPKPPLNNFGSYQGAIRQIRASRPMSLTWPKCQSLGHPKWKKRARKAVFEAFQYEPGPLDLKPRVIQKIETEDFIAEKVLYHTAPWFEVPAYFLLPRHGRAPYPAVYLMHEWGGNPLFGKERVIRFGNEPPILLEHQRVHHSGRGLANEFTKRGYAVLVADAFYFGERSPRGFADIPAKINAYETPMRDAVHLHQLIAQSVYSAVRYLAWAGTTWAGLFTWDDIRGIDYLVSRPEVDAKRIACTGLSVGAWRTNLLAALDDRIKASASVMWMTTGDAQHDYNVQGAVGAFCILPSLWRQLDVPDFSVMAAPNATMVVSGQDDLLFPLKGQSDAAKHIAAGFRWAGCPKQCRLFNPKKPHVYDADIQEAVFEWFGLHLKPGG